jgi:hypothetical protein
MSIEKEVREAQVRIADDPQPAEQASQGESPPKTGSQSIRKKLSEFGGAVDKQSKRFADRLRGLKGGVVSEFRGMRDDKTSLYDGDRLSHVVESNAPVSRLVLREVPAHVTSGIACFGVGLGVLANEVELMRLTRALMDDDGGALQQFLRPILATPAGADINSWMDRVPNSEIAGGFAHRLFHGHDVAGLVELINNHAPTEAIVNWFNHVWLRDFWTPHGVPWLPSGSGSAYEFLRSFDVISSTTAMDVLTINAAEAASGLFLLGGGLRIRDAIRTWIERSRYAKHLSAAIDCAQEGNHQMAGHELRDAELHVADAPADLRLEAASFALAQATPEKSPEQILDYAGCAWDIANGIFDPKQRSKTIPYHGGTRVSFLGIVTTIMTSAYSLMNRNKERDWDRNQREQTRLGVSACMAIARSQAETGWTGRRARFRPYSALSNQVLALELAHAASFLREPMGDPPGIRRAIGKTLLACEGLPEVHQEYIKQLADGIERLYPIGAGAATWTRYVRDDFRSSPAAMSAAT